MTTNELYQEKRCQIWLRKTINLAVSEQKMFQKQAEWAIEQADYDGQKEKLKDQYINGILTDREYKNAKKEIENIEKNNTWKRNMARDKREFGEMYLLAIEALLEEIQGYIEESKVGKKPKVYGYDPRRPISKHNYPRTDWGQTRKHANEHQRKKGHI